MRRRSWPTFDSARAALSGIRPVRVRFVRGLRKDGEPHDGVATWDRVSASVCLEAALTEREAVDALVHEVAHILADTDGHGPRWGVAYARCYRAVEAA